MNKEVVFKDNEITELEAQGYVFDEPTEAEIDNIIVFNSDKCKSKNKKDE